MFNRTLAILFILGGVSARADDPVEYPSPPKVKEAFLKLLDRPKVPLDPKVLDTKEQKNGWVLERLDIASEKKLDGSIERVPMIVLRPGKSVKKLPAVIVLHRTGSSMRAMQSFLEQLAERNIIGVAIDARYHGERLAGQGSAAYLDAIIAAWRTKSALKMEHPLFYDTCWDVWRTIDYLMTRDDIDGKRLGIIGFGMGGVETWLAGAVDDRVKVAVSAIAVQSFRWNIDHDNWLGSADTVKKRHEAAAFDLGLSAVNHYACRSLWIKVIPDIIDQFDCPSMLRLFAGRPLLILSGTKDNICPYPGARIAIESAQRAFKDARAKEKLAVVAEDVGHIVTPRQRDAALAWFERWLK